MKSLPSYPNSSTSSAMDASNLKIWDNAAFNDFIADYPTGAKSLLPLQPISTNLLHLPNLSPYKDKSSKKPERHDVVASIPNDGNVDAEIEQVEKEIRRLSLKLEGLRIKKAEMDPKSSAVQRGRIIPTKFMDQKRSPVSKKMGESPAKLGRRGSSLGPLEIHGGAAKSCFQKLERIKEENTPPNPQPFLTRARTRKSWLRDDSFTPCFRQRGFSLGPSEIASGARFSKLQEITKKQSFSVSPKSRKPTTSTVSELRKGIATAGAKKPVKKEDSIIGSVKTQNLFKDIQNPVSCRKPLKKATVRTVASRYSLSTARNQEADKKQRKFSLPEPENLSFSLGETSNGGEPLLTASSPLSFMKITTMLPKIRTVRNIADSARDSGCAPKRAAQLAGKKSHFSMEECSSQDSIVDFPCNFLKFEEQ